MSKPKLKPGDLVWFVIRSMPVFAVLVQHNRTTWSVDVFLGDKPKRWRVYPEHMTKIPSKSVPDYVSAGFMRWKHGVER